MSPIDEVFEDVMEGLAWGKRGMESDNVAILRRDESSITADYGDEDAYFVVVIQQVPRDGVELPPPPRGAGHQDV